MIRGVQNLDEAPPRHRDEIRRAAARAIRLAGARPPLVYVGIGMTGVVFCDAAGKRAWKVARHPDSAMLEEEAEWLRVASTVPGVREHVSRHVRFHERANVIERECVGLGGPRSERERKRTGLHELHEKIGKAMQAYGYSAPEYKEDSYVYAPGRGWLLVDAGFAHLKGTRLAARAGEVLKGARFAGERPSDLAWALRMEAGKTVPTKAAHGLSDKLLALADAEVEPKKRTRGHVLRRLKDVA